MPMTHARSGRPRRAGPHRGRHGRVRDPALHQRAAQAGADPQGRRRRRPDDLRDPVRVVSRRRRQRRLRPHARGRRRPTLPERQPTRRRWSRTDKARCRRSRQTLTPEQIAAVVEYTRNEVGSIMTSTACAMRASRGVRERVRAQLRRARRGRRVGVRHPRRRDGGRPLGWRRRSRDRPRVGARHDRCRVVVHERRDGAVRAHADCRAASSHSTRQCATTGPSSRRTARMRSPCACCSRTRPVSRHSASRFPTPGTATGS